MIYKNFSLNNVDKKDPCNYEPILLMAFSIGFELLAFRLEFSLARN